MVLTTVLELRGFIICSALAIAVLVIWVIVMMGRRKQGIKDFGLQAMFYARTWRELLCMALSISEVTFVLSVCIWGTEMGTVQIATLGLICIIRGIIELSIAGLISELLFGISEGMALFLGGMLLSYMKQTGTDWYILVIQILLALFVTQYAVYHIIRSTGRILKHGATSTRRQETPQ